MKINRLLKKDRYGIMRGGIILGVLILVCSLLFTGIVVRRDISFESERASLATQQAAVQIEQLVHEKMKLMDDTAAYMSDDESVQEDALKRLEDDNGFEKAAVEENGVLYFTDGSTSQATKAQLYPYVIDGRSSHSFIIEKDNVQARTEMDNGKVLVAWVDPAEFIAIMENALDGDHQFAIFNVETGELLINRTGFDNTGYYNILHSLNDKGAVELLLDEANAQVHVDINGETNCIAQRSLALHPFGIAMFVPQDLLGSVALNGSADSIFVICCTLILMLVLVLHTVLLNRRIGIANRNAARALDVSDQLVNVVSEDAGITAFVYQCSGDNLITCYNGLKIGQDAPAARVSSLSDLKTLCGMADGEIERIYDRVSELRPGENADIIVQCFRQTNEEYLLRFSFHASRDETRNVLCTISDCTREQEAEDRAERENRYQRSIQNKASSIWQVNITRNRWQLLYSNKQLITGNLSRKIGEKHDYTADLNNSMRDILHAEDYDAFMECVSISSISAAFRSGKTEITHDYRVARKQPGAYKWHRVCIRIWLDARTNDVLANMYVFNVDAEKQAEIERGLRKRMMKQTLTALGGMYFGLYYVDLENDLCYTSRSLDGELVNQLSRPYQSSFIGFVNEFVHPDDREDMHKMLSAYLLRKNMKEGSHYQRREYRRKVSDDTYRRASLIIQPARFENGTIREVVIAVQYVDRESDALK